LSIKKLDPYLKSSHKKAPGPDGLMSEIYYCYIFGGTGV
jgi:hypothetical protein